MVAVRWKNLTKLMHLQIAEIPNEYIASVGLRVDIATKLRSFLS